jgi:hypothetical protein
MYLAQKRLVAFHLDMQLAMASGLLFVWEKTRCR